MSDTGTLDIAASLTEVRRRVVAAAIAAGRSADEVTLVAVSKTKPAGDVRQAIEAGQRVFGENRVQEALAKFAELRPDTTDLELHLIGPLQTNKVRDAVEGFEVIETVDRPKLAEAIATELARRRAAGQPGRLRQCLIEINTGEEPQKAGILPADADAFIRDCVDRLALPITGLMCIPPADQEPSPHFAFLREIARRHGLKTLSMGMSGDYEVAIRLGATHVRVGTAIFGGRPPVVATL
ncbi:MAG TPA: YggS family pyridoxal phosphate-dependent enzyme [Stellaceae bacterium]|nr:YggS family pyridoxal phosphate-dependent enzyme [Stellaceae bacterium]